MNKTIKLNQIVCDAGTQSRANINSDAVTEYAERMIEGDRFPAVDVFFDGNQYYLADGFHRILAASRNGFTDFECNIHKGTLEDALWFAIGANRKSGVQRSPGDKRKAIELALEKFPSKSQKEIADHVGCSQSHVAAVKKGNISVILPQSRKAKDGRVRPTQYKKQVAPEPEPEEIEPEEPVHIVAYEPDLEQESEQFTHEHIVEFEATIADLQCLLRGECCEKSDLETIAENLKVCLKLVQKLAKEAA